MRLTDVLREGSVSYHDGSGHHHARRGWIQVDCPFCSPGSGKFRMGFNNSGQYWNCWVCGSYKLWDGLKAVLGMTDREVGALLQGEKFEQYGQQIRVRERGTLQIPKGVGPLLPQHKRYLFGRRLDAKELEKVWKIQGIGLAAKLQWRIFIPIIYHGEVVSWTTRSLSENVGSKYLTAQATQEKIFHKELLFGEDFARHAIIINEGPLDAMAIGPGAVATLSVNYTRAQLWRMSKYPIRVVAFDNEPDAQRRARRLVDELSVFEGATYNARFSTGKDASRASKAEVEELRRRFLGD